MTAVLDSSALLALLWSEPGSDAVVAVMDDAVISAVNMAEVCSKLVDRGIVGEEIRALLSELAIRVATFDEAQAFKVGDLRLATRTSGLSIGDRACLALAASENLNAVTADRAWSNLDLGISITLIR
jgi:PIN domain nuclease of toxin-antitoxin system